MTPLFTRNERLVEKSFLAAKDQLSWKDKFCMSLLALLVVLFALNIYQTIVNASAIEIIF